ncbi:hypothetical protein SDC9_209621 [bioreactor metagenome]|uniref:Uncharacterized protein n=1 Tax=bioreactor metagenome TaxID=1076179 RepID=A0A645JEH4_9ZZZZ
MAERHDVPLGSLSGILCEPSIDPPLNRIDTGLGFFVRDDTVGEGFHLADSIIRILCRDGYCTGKTCEHQQAASENGKEFTSH